MSAGPWKVRVFIWGKPAGSYSHPTEEAAKADAKDREKNYSVLGFRYEVNGPAAPVVVKIRAPVTACHHSEKIRVTGFCYDESRCAKCGAYLGEP